MSTGIKWTPWQKTRARHEANRIFHRGGPRNESEQITLWYVSHNFIDPPLVEPFVLEAWADQIISDYKQGIINAPLP